MTLRIDINADLGEGYPTDEAMAAIVSTVNIAAGGHAGGGKTLLQTCVLAREYNLNAGAHISYPDRDNFGRVTRPDIPFRELHASLSAQLHDVLEAADSVNIPITHIKAHGALYNDAANDLYLADLLCHLAHENPTHGILPLMGLPGSKMEILATTTDTPFIREGFADRAYQQDGTLTPRSQPGAVHTHPEHVATQALALATGAPIILLNGATLRLDVDSICVHGDNDNAVQQAAAIRSQLEARNIHITPPTIEK